MSKIHGSEPWKTGGDAAYQYHPGGDHTRGKRDAPSALNEVIIPNVNLPRVSDHYPLSLFGGLRKVANEGRQELHEKYNKWGKEGY